MSEERIAGTPVKNRKCLVELVGGFLASAPSSQVERTSVWVWILRTAIIVFLFLEVGLIPLADALALTVNGGNSGVVGEIKRTF